MKMKIDIATLLATLLLLASPVSISAKEDDGVSSSTAMTTTTTTTTTSSLRGGGARGGHRALYTSDDCILVFVETEIEQLEGEGEEEGEGEGEESRIHGDKDKNDDDDDMDIRCELSSKDAEAFGTIFVPISGMSSESVKQITSGVTTIRAGGAMLNQDGQLELPLDGSVAYGTIDESNVPEHRRRRMSKVTGTNKVIVIRVDADDGAPQDSLTQLEDAIFGRYGNIVNLMTIYRDCSYGQMTIEPFQGETTKKKNVEYGVAEVKVKKKLYGEDRFTAQSAVEDAAMKELGDLRSEFDHVMICLPPGTRRSGSYNWLAYAYVNSWLSVYNDKWCSRVSTQVHEFGHTLNLGHSGLANDPYNDKSGMMGYSYDMMQRPVQCFNPAKSFQLGWYKDEAITINAFLPQGFRGTLKGVVDYKFGDTPAEYVVIRIPDVGGNDLYVGYNRKKSINRQTQAAQDKIVLVRQNEGYAQSYRVADIGITKTYSQPNYYGSGLTLCVTYVSRSKFFDKAEVDIRTVEGECPKVNQLP
mmetsp:Transcript_59060/g.144516  ORF Transcript_59060/g.144516 Transcript_59060/m.144516 type:complete len:528 (-) Transcript_59060:145-1728(-)